ALRRARLPRQRRRLHRLGRPRARPAGRRRAGRRRPAGGGAPPAAALPARVPAQALSRRRLRGLRREGRDRVMRALAGALLLAAAAGPAAALDDLAGWEGLRWGMTAAEIRDALGDRVAALPGRWLYGGAYAELAVEDVEIGGLAFTAYLQMSAESHRLQQVLLERRRTGALPA